jgi:hypothetical protein
MTKRIGDPLEQVALTGKIGSRSATQKSSSSDSQVASVSATQTSENLNVQSASSSTSQKSGSSKVQKSRVQQTVYLPPDLAKRVKHQAIEEDREISEIVTDALEMYLQSR